MGSCNCGGKTVKFKTGQVKKATVKKATIAKSTGKPSKRSAALSRQARAKALKNSSPCNCTQ